MGIPSHGPGCRTYGYTGECRLCGKDTFFFFCNHGTKLLLDSPNYPWVFHQCSLVKYSELIDLIFEVFGKVDQTVINRLEIIGLENGWEILPEAMAEIKAFLARTISEPKKIEINPGSDKRMIYASLLNTNPNVNLYKRFGYEKNDLSRQLLGKLGNGSYNEILLREHNYHKNEIRNYTVLIREDNFLKNNLRCNKKYFVGLNGFEVPCKTNVWIAEYIKS